MLSTTIRRALTRTGLRYHGGTYILPAFGMTFSSDEMIITVTAKPKQQFDDPIMVQSKTKPEEPET